MTLQHQETEIVPSYVWYTPPVEKMLQKHYGTEDVEEEIGNHLLLVEGKGIRPLYANPKVYGKLTEDEFGVVWRNNPYDRGIVHKHPLENPKLEGYEFPDPHRPGRFDRIARILEDKPDVFAIGIVGDLWERCRFMTGFTNLLRYLFTAPDFVEDLLDGLTEYILTTLDELSLFPIEGIFVSDDYGTQRGLQISPLHWQTFIKPRLKRIFDHAKNRGLFTSLHSDGNLMAILPDLIEIGLDILNPVQPEAMDPYEVKRLFGDKLCIWGALGTQRLLNSGTREKIHMEVERAKTVLGQEGGYILGPAINLQRDCPLQNILTFIEAARAPRATES